MLTSEESLVEEVHSLPSVRIFDSSTEKLVGSSHGAEQELGGVMAGSPDYRFGQTRSLGSSSSNFPRRFLRRVIRRQMIKPHL